MRKMTRNIKKEFLEADVEAIKKHMAKIDEQVLALQNKKSDYIIKLFHKSLAIAKLKIKERSLNV